MLDKSAGVHFTLVDFHITLGRNQSPRAGHVASRHVCVANVLINNSIYLTHNSALMSVTSRPATSETAETVEWNHHQHCNEHLPHERSPWFYPELVGPYWFFFTYLNRILHDWHCISAKCPFCCPTNSVRALKETQSNDHDQWSCLICPSATIRQIDSAFYPTWDGKMSTSQRPVMLCGWEGNRRPGEK